MEIFKIVIKVLLFIIVFRIVFIEVETGCDKFEKMYAERDCDWGPGEGPGSTWKWRFTGNEIKIFSSSPSRESYPERDGHAYTECSWFGSEIWINGYIKDDGTQVEGDYRKRPSCWD